MIVGNKGQKYGLIKTSLFSADDDVPDIKQQLAEEEVFRRQTKKNKRQQEEALASDPMAFAYDEVYDDMKKANKRERRPANAEKKPKYIKALLKKAAERERENEVVFQHRIQREAEAEKELFGEDMKEYITPSYKKQLEKNKRYEEKQKRMEEEDEKNDVRKKGDMLGFYSNLLNNVSSGGTGFAEPSSSSSESESEGDRDSPETAAERSRLKRKRAEEALEQATKLQQEREEEEKRKAEELKTTYAQHQTSVDEAEAARARFLARKKARLGQ